MFIGEYQHNIDSKGRMAVPAKFRGRLGKGAIITRGLDRCLFIYTAAEWKTLAGEVMKYSILKSDSRSFARFIMSSATEIDFDSQGRALIPASLREYAGLKKETIIAGVFNRLEVWDAAAWKNFRAKAENNSDAIAEKLSDLGL